MAPTRAEPDRLDELVERLERTAAELRAGDLSTARAAALVDDKPQDVQLSASVELEVTHTEPGMRGDTASGGGNKPATLETGATIRVPLCVNIGDRVKVQTESGEYMSRA